MNQNWHSNGKRHWPCASAPPFERALFERRYRIDMNGRVVAYQNRRDGEAGELVDKPTEVSHEPVA